MDANLDAAELCRTLGEKWGPLAATPAKLFALTPFELLALFTRPRGGDEVDRLAELRRVNHAVRAPAGLPPAVPSWLMPKVPRWTRSSKSSSSGPTA